MPDQPQPDSSSPEEKPAERANTLASPWRMDYIKKLDASYESGKPEADKPLPCFLCDAATCDESGFEDRLILIRDGRGILLLNRYPYTSGHLLVAPHDHKGDLTDLTADQRAGLMELATVGEVLLKMTYNPQGVNLGINLGRAAGAGVPGHLHVHLVPRWAGDTNFMSSVAGVRVLPQSLEHSYEWLRDAVGRLDG